VFQGGNVPPKIRDLITELERAGFVNRGGKGSHRNFVHPRLAGPVTISGGLGDDARYYQVRAVRRAIEESKR
jgi:predicted RNA binding protein YcfA (HicA-like mRNA interferase family)